MSAPPPAGAPAQAGATLPSALGSAVTGLDAFGPFALLTLHDQPFRFRWIPPGTFIRGSPPDEEGRDPDERPHAVTLTEGFYLGETPVTQAQWQAVMGHNPSRFARGGGHPVEQVSWENCNQFCAHLAPLPARLPTEAEWEYACRAGTLGPNWAPGRPLAELCWFADNAGGRTHPVARRQPNPWGLFDMLGNVWEWCADAWTDYPDEAQVDPCPREGEHRVVRGGGFAFPASAQRAAFRLGFPPDHRRPSLGLRLCVGPDWVGPPKAPAAR